MVRRTLLGVALLLAGCSQDPAGNYLRGFGDPVRGAALFAPRNLGDTSRWRGNPAGAAMAADQLEFLTESFTTNPLYAPRASAAVLHALRAARTEMRGWLGIAPDASTAVVREGLRNAAAALNDASQVRAETALSGPAFTLGPQATLTRLATMPRLPRTAEAAGMVAAEIDRMDRQR